MSGFTNHSSRSRRGVRALEFIRAVLGSACVLWACMAVFAAPARALERMVPDSPFAVVSTDGKTVASHATMDDACLALLKTDSGDASPSYAPAPDASRTAVIGFVFGLRFALGPKPAAGHRASLAVWQPGVTGSDQALAISGYRHCRNEAALRDFNR